MFYAILRSYIRLALRWYIPVIKSKAIDKEQAKVPHIIVSNHPNSFLDALLIAAHSPFKLYFLADGHFFRKPVANVLLRQLYVLPVFKRKDCADFGVRNDFTYDECIRQLKAGNHVLIFPEAYPELGSAEQVAPFFNAGMTSILERAYSEGVPVQVLPCMLDYGPTTELPRQVEIDFKPIVDTTEYIADQEIMSAEVIVETRRSMGEQQIMLALPEELGLTKSSNLQNFLAQIGHGLQGWFYRFVRSYVSHRAAGSRHFDALLFLGLLVSYPLAVLFVSYIIGRIGGFWLGLFVFLFLPLTAYFMTRNKEVKRGKGTVG